MREQCYGEEELERPGSMVLPLFQTRLLLLGGVQFLSHYFLVNKEDVMKGCLCRQLPEETGIPNC